MDGESGSADDGNELLTSSVIPDFVWNEELCVCRDSFIVPIVHQPHLHNLFFFFFFFALDFLQMKISPH